MGNKYLFLEDDDDYSFSKYKFGDKIDNDRFKYAVNYPQSINYTYLQMDTITEYHFTQLVFDNRDIIAYFTFMKILSSNNFSKLIDDRNREWHLYQTHYRGRFKQLIDKTIAKDKRSTPEQLPTFYHFALYTDKEQANRCSQKKSPRIYFFLGDNATIYPLFYDPYHEINP